MSVRRYWDPIRRLVVVIAFGVFCVLVVLRHYFSFALAIGDSMLPTLNSGDLLLISRKSYRQLEPCRGDIVLARLQHDLVVKRVVGLPGEEVEVKDGCLYINGVLIPEHQIVTNVVKFDIAKGKLFPGRFATLGDNRAIPPIQTIHPIISKDQIFGKVLLSINISRLRIKYLGNA